ncbi:MAG: hypothetical protein IJY09_03405 [Lachnospiraceae bacterium]|nr:hypothetical protein [Lachnospiraceae bacterium]
MRYEDDIDRLPRSFAVVEILLLIVFTVLDVFQWVPVVSDALKMLSVVLCFIFSISLLFSIDAENDRILLMLSLTFTVVAAVLVLFTDYYAFAMLACCLVQEFHAARIFQMKKSLVRIDGRIDALYRNYKVRNSMFFMNLLLLLLAAIPVLVSLFVELPELPLLCASVFYFVCLLGNVLRMFKISRDIRLLDDMRPLRAYFAGILLHVLSSISLFLVLLPECFGVTLFPSEVARIVMLVIQPIYLIGLVCITFSGCRKQEFYT